MYGGEVKVLPYIRPVMQGLPAGPDEIRWKRPYLYDVLFWDKLSSGLPFPGLTCYAINRVYLRNSVNYEISAVLAIRCAQAATTVFPW